MRRLSVLVVTGAVLAVALQVAPSANGAASRPATVRVATFNVLDAHKDPSGWKDRRATVLHLVKEARADVLVLQEAKQFGRARWQDPAAWLARKAGYEVVKRQTVPDSGTDANGYYYSSGTPMILYRAATVRFEPSPYRLREDFFPPTSRKGLRATFSLKRTGQRFHLVAAHLTAGSSSRLDGRRRDELVEVASEQDWAVRNGAGSAPTVWAGDFNTMAKKGSPVRSFLRERGLVDSFAKAKSKVNPTLNTYNGLKRKAAATGRRIDHIWVPKGTKVVQWHQVARIRDGRYRGRFASDHNPVVVTLKLGG